VDPVEGVQLLGAFLELFDDAVNGTVGSVHGCTRGFSLFNHEERL
jgi:hypothetical protein